MYANQESQFAKLRYCAIEKILFKFCVYPQSFLASFAKFLISVRFLIAIY